MAACCTAAILDYGLCLRVNTTLQVQLLTFMLHILPSYLYCALQVTDKHIAEFGVSQVSAYNLTLLFPRFRQDGVDPLT